MWFYTLFSNTKIISCVRFELDFRGQIFKDDAGDFFEYYLARLSVTVHPAKEVIHAEIGEKDAGKGEEA